MICSSPQRSHSLLRFIGVVSLLTFAALLGFQFGQRGFLPLDHSIVFAGASEIACGRVPIADVAIPAGLSLAFLQAALFSALGTSWFSYLVASAVLNAVAAVACYLLLAPRFPAISVPALFGASTAVLFIPPIGTPYPDHGSFAFSLLDSLTA